MNIRKRHEQATEFSTRGETFVAVDDDSGLCDKCAFFRDVRCADTPFCTPSRRNDGRSIVWVKKQEEK